MFKFFRFKSKEEFDASVNEHWDKYSEKLFKKCKKIFEDEFYNTVYCIVQESVRSKYEINERMHSKLESKIIDRDHKIKKLEEQIDFLNIKLDVILSILRIEK